MSKIYNLSNRLSRVFAGHSPLTTGHCLSDHCPLTTHHSNQRGAILITMLLLMVIVTLLGVIAINTSTIDIQITGYAKRESLAFQGAEAGIDLSIPVIEQTIAEGTLTPTTIPITIGTTTTNYSLTGDPPNLASEILNDQPASELSAFNADISISNVGQGVEVKVDIDRLYSYALPGGSLEFAAGYEGVGAGAGGGGVGILYSIDSQGTL